MTDDDVLDGIDIEEGIERDLARSTQRLSVRTETRRYGKTVTVVEGFDPSATDGDLGDVASELKRALGTGGTATEDTVELQGDHADRVPGVLRDRGFTVAD